MTMSQVKGQIWNIPAIHQYQESKCLSVEDIQDIYLLTYFIYS